VVFIDISRRNLKKRSPPPLASAVCPGSHREALFDNGSRLADVRSVLRSAANLSLNDLTISLSLSV